MSIRTAFNYLTFLYWTVDWIVRCRETPNLSSFFLLSFSFRAHHIRSMYGNTSVDALQANSIGARHSLPIWPAMSSGPAVSKITLKMCSAFTATWWFLCHKTWLGELSQSPWYCLTKARLTRQQQSTTCIERWQELSCRLRLKNVSSAHSMPDHGYFFNRIRKKREWYSDF